MEIHEYPISFRELCNLEKKTLRAIACDPGFIKNPGIASEVPKAQDAVIGERYCFNCYWDSQCEFEGATDCRLFLSEQFSRGSGINISDVIDMTICLCVAKLGCKKKVGRVLRKYHFDFTRDHEEGLPHRRQHPLYHVQYAGNVSGFLEEHDITATDIEHMCPSLSEPRLFHYPITLAMAFSIAFREFPDDSSVKLFESSGWQKVLRNNEEQVVKPFLKEFSKLVSKADKQRDTLFDFLYTSK